MVRLTLSLLLVAARDDDPTWAQDVAPILHRHCVVCHRPGEAAPFSLLDHDDAKDHARQIVQVTQSRLMPPWLAAPSDPPFVAERRLSDAEIATLSRWAEAGAPAGDLAAAPAPPHFPSGWQLGPPDLVVTMTEPFVVPADGIDLYRNFVIPVPVESMKYVRAVELRPGNARVVHHAVIKLDRTDASRRLDAKDPAPGFEEMETGEATSPDGHFLGWTPGRTTVPLPEGMAWRLPPGSDLVIQLHLLPAGKPEPVQSSVGLYFTAVPPARLPFLLRLGSQSLDIPAGESAYAVTDRFTLPAEVALHAIAPHAHFLGRSVRTWATLPDGTSRTLLEIPRWDFSWQDEFRFVEPVKLPAGTTLAMEWIYDNSSANPRNPRSPPERVRFGPSSLEEMCDVWLQVVPDGRAAFEALQREFAQKELAMLRAGFEARLAIEPDDAQARLDLGLALARQGKLAAARAELERAAALDPASARAQVQLGLVRLREGAREEALRCLERAVALEPDHAGALLELGRLAEEDGDLVSAVAWVERAAAARPKLYAARMNLGRLLDLRGEDARAATEYEAGLAIDPTASDLRRALAWLRATSRDAVARDGRRALELAKQLVASERIEVLDLDVLAAAQAECGRFKAAAGTAAKAAELARRRGEEALAAAIDERRRGYERHEQHRE